LDDIQGLITWLENNQETEKDEYDRILKSLEIANPIMKRYNSADGIPSFRSGDVVGTEECGYVLVNLVKFLKILLKIEINF